MRLMVLTARPAKWASLIAATALVSCHTARAQVVPPTAGQQWATTWSAEFNNGASDLLGWSYDVGAGGWGNNEVQTYTAPPGSPPSTPNPFGLPGRQTTPTIPTNNANVFVSTDPNGGTGALHINAIGTGSPTTYTSGRIKTGPSTTFFNQTYGLFEFRGKFPAGNGLWPAVWMLPKDMSYGGWPNSGEIDIFEGKGQDSGWASSALHSGTPGGVNTQSRTFQQSGLRPPGWSSTDWHTYSLKWTDGPGTGPGTMTFYIDGVAYHTRTGGWTVPAGQPNSAPFDQPFYILVNMAVGGNFVGGLTPGPGTYDMQIDFIRAYSAITAGGDPTWAADASGNWSGADNWINAVIPNSLSATAQFGGVITQPRTVTVDTPITAGTLIFDNPASSYTIGGTQTLSLNTSGAPAAINVISGDHTFSAPLALQRNTTITVTQPAGALTVSGPISLAAGTTLTKAGPGATRVLHIRGGSLSIDAGLLQILSGNGGAGTSKIESLEILSDAALDLHDSSLIVDYTSGSPLVPIRDKIISGFNGGTWEGDGINSSAAASGVGAAIGYAEASVIGVTSFGGLSVDATAVLVRYTLAGDANLDGVANLNDFNALAANFGTSGMLWHQGDFSYDGVVNLTDFNLLAANFGLSAGPLGPTPQDWAALAAAVPEPSGLAVLAASGGLGLRRSRRR